jgi:hypothetical protein
VEPEGVVNALRTIHRALVPGGLVIDTQPVSALPPVEMSGRELGTVDMREWARMIAAVDERVAETLADGLFELVEERRFVVTDTFDSGAELVAEVREWAGTVIPPDLAERVQACAGPARLHADVRLRLLVSASPVSARTTR